MQLRVREALDVAERVVPEAGNDLLAGLLQNDRLEIRADERDQQRDAVEGHEREQLRQLELVLDQFADAPHDERGDDVVDDGHEHDEQREHEPSRVRLSVNQQAPEDLAVGHVALEADSLLFVLHEGKSEYEQRGENADRCADY